MRALWLIPLSFAVDASAASFYKHAAPDGTITYSDRPALPGQAPIALPPVNVSTPEARRQLDLARARWDREEREEQEARMRQWSAAQRAASVGYSRPLSPSYPRSTYAYPTYFYPTFYAVTPGSQSRSPETRHSGGHRGHRSRR